MTVNLKFFIRAQRSQNVTLKINLTVWSHFHSIGMHSDPIRVVQKIVLILAKIRCTYLIVKKFAIPERHWNSFSLHIFSAPWCLGWNLHSIGSSSEASSQSSFPSQRHRIVIHSEPICKTVVVLIGNVIEKVYVITLWKNKKFTVSSRRENISWNQLFSYYLTRT